MKKLFLSLSLLTGLNAPALAENLKHQTALDLEAMALVYLIEASEVSVTESPRSIGDALKDAWKKLQDLKQQLLDQFDTDKNGQIDPGPELDNFKETIKSVILILADSNQNGKIDAEDIKELTLFYLKQAEATAKTKLCPEIIAKAEAAGDSIAYRPLLKHLYEQCLLPEPTPY